MVVAIVVVKAEVAVAIVVQLIAVVMVVAIVAVVGSWTAVAAAAEIAGMDWVAVALLSPLQHNIMHSKFNLYI